MWRCNLHELPEEPHYYTFIVRGRRHLCIKKSATRIFCQSWCHAHWEQCKLFTLRTEWDWTHSAGNTNIRFKLIVTLFYTIQEERLDVSPECFTHHESNSSEPKWCVSGIFVSREICFFICLCDSVCGRSSCVSADRVWKPAGHHLCESLQAAPHTC